MAFDAFPFLERLVRDFVQQAFNFRAVRLMAPVAIGAFCGNQLMGILQGLVIHIMTLCAKVTTRKHILKIRIMGLMTFTTHLIFCRTVFEGVIFHLFGQVRVAGQTQASGRPIQLSPDQTSMRIMAGSTFPLLERTMNVFKLSGGIFYFFVARITISGP